MARRLNVPFLAVAAVGAAMALLAACGGSPADQRSNAGPTAKKVTIGGLDVTITPTRLDSAGAEFKVAFDTHTGAPDLDVAASSTLVVDGIPWTAPAWSGDGPGDHHRAGTLRFSAAGPARGAATLNISGLDGPMEASWDLP